MKFFDDANLAGMAAAWVVGLGAYALFRAEMATGPASPWVWGVMPILFAAGTPFGWVAWWFVSGLVEDGQEKRAKERERLKNLEDEVRRLQQKKAQDD